MVKAKRGNRVKIHYTGKLKDGRVFDTSDNHDPLQFEIGKGEVISGLEEAVLDMEQGEKKTVNIPAEKAYGSYHREKVVSVEKSRIPAHISPEVGKKLKLLQPDGQTDIVRITDISDTEVTLDANHPLAGKDLMFEIQMVEIV